MAGNYVLEYSSYTVFTISTTSSRRGVHDDVKGIVMLSCCSASSLKQE